MHAGDMRLIDRSPYDRYITVFKYVSAIPLLKLVAPLWKNDVVREKG